ncbi:MAG TPA: stage II sporulation protein P [Methylomusa anaerophila]|uniref:Stage II sporulation protein P n=1 Tax=Methylomusa anaerophila TaxID=1930071 RepID=A0A348ANX1_9FIRM|nr:stage II sporulation protein P [Methylomusa anaerophila]BBB92769.1 Stage II sporulation protein P [Methylomusa anaerophila]HML87380.1 stage II sporulation protein P [Methylomusa anaerophila]
MAASIAKSRKQRKQGVRKSYFNIIRIFKVSRWVNVLLISMLLCCVAIISWGTYEKLPEAAMPVSAMKWRHDSLLMPLWPNWREVLFNGIPGLSTIIEPIEQPAPVKIVPEIDTNTFTQRCLFFLAGINTNDWKMLFSQEIPLLLTFGKPGSPAVNAASLPNFPAFDANATNQAGKPLVGIYHTHTAESFIPDSGASHKPGGQRGDIVDVGAALAKHLEKNGIVAVQSQTIHDYPSFMKAYGVSELTAQKMLAENPSIQMIFDIHRDAGKRQDFTATVYGLPVAKISIVVAIGQQDLPQPHWQQNHAFAKLIEARLNSKFPGLFAGIQLEDWRFNQHLHPRALLLEVGCQENTKEEAIRSIEMLGDVLVEIIAESKNQQR